MRKFTELKIKKFHWLVLLVIPMLIIACGAPNVEWELAISGNVSNPVTFTFDELAKMELVDLNDVLMEKSRGEDEVRSFSGVSLDSLFETAGAPDNFSTIIVKAADGYAIEISKDEMVNGIVALKQSDKWIVDDEPDAGPIRLVFPSTPADHWVFQVFEIIVNP